MNTQIDLAKLLVEAEDEIDLLPYFAKLELQRLGVPVIIEPTDIRNPEYEVTTGSLEYKINVDSMIMEIHYEPAENL